MSRRRAFHFGWPFWCLLLALVLLGFTYAKPKLPWQQAIYRYLFVIDITQSMNVRDYPVEGLPADRLAFVKETLRQVLQRLPCGSAVGLGLFTHKNMHLLFEPIEVCAHFPIIDDVIAHIDWRMAWAADSYIARGLFTSIRDIGALGGDVRLAFFTDGQQTPPIPRRPPFLADPEEVKGFIVGVGGLKPAPIPKLDLENRPLGYWQQEDIETGPIFRYSLTPAYSTEAKAAQDLYLSKLDEAELKTLASITGLYYHRLESPEKLNRALQTPELAQRRVVENDIRWLFALAALVLIIAPYLSARGKKGSISR